MDPENSFFRESNSTARLRVVRPEPWELAEGDENSKYTMDYDLY